MEKKKQEEQEERKKGERDESENETERGVAKTKKWLEKSGNRGRRK